MMVRTGAALTIRLTGSGDADPHAPALAPREPIYVPAAKPIGFTETESVPGVVPLAGFMESQLPLLVAVAVNGPAAPVQVNETVCGAEPAPPVKAVNDSEPALNTNDEEIP